MVHRKLVLRAALLTAALAIMAGSAVAQNRAPSRGGSTRGPTLAVGQPAPDVELSPLAFKENDKGEMVGIIGEEKIKLSAYKGRAPIVIFSSSYT